MDEKTRLLILDRVLKKQAFRDQHHSTQPANFAFFHSLEWRASAAESENRLSQKYLLQTSGSPAP